MNIKSSLPKRRFFDIVTDPFVILLGILFLVYLRAPNLLIHPRLWAEEGSVFLQYAYQYPWHITILSPHQGYYSFLTNFVSLFARVVPLQYAPFITTYTALVIQMIPYVIILWGKSCLWNNPMRKIIGCMIVLLSPAATGEVWLNTTNVHFHLCVISFLILLEPVDNISRVRRTLYRVLLLIGGLTSVPSVFLLPLFVISALQERKRERLMQAGLLFLCLFLQIIALTSELKSERLHSGMPLLDFGYLKEFVRAYLRYGIKSPLGWDPLPNFMAMILFAATFFIGVLNDIFTQNKKLFLMKTTGAYILVICFSIPSFPAYYQFHINIFAIFDD